FLPGVAGTYLDEVTSDPNFAARVNLWPFSYGSSQGMLLKPDGITPAYTSQAGYHVVTNGIFANHGMTSGANPFNFYGGFEDYLVNNEGYTLGKDLVEFPYDWRLDNQIHLAELDHLVNQVDPPQDNPR
ncbi:hypothetical protein, partial [Candidatus Nitrosotalea sp. FS]|uniref:hypothetical protein n=1 Tax=Candidatus Nitrosotalea sp. FS TaxID=2341021 RepID=UPI00140CD1FC